MCVVVHGEFATVKAGVLVGPDVQGARSAGAADAGSPGHQATSSGCGGLQLFHCCAVQFVVRGERAA